MLDSFAFLGYKLCKRKGEKLIYSLDYQVLLPAEQEEYFKIFEAGGWTHVCSQGSIHVFSAKPGTQTIYSDNNTMREKYKRAITSWRLSTVIFSLVASVSVVIQILIEQNLALVNAIGILSIVLAVPSLMTYMAFVVKLRRLNKGQAV